MGGWAPTCAVWKLPTASGVFKTIQQHQGFSRHSNEAAQALQLEFGQQDDGILMILSKQSQ